MTKTDIEQREQYDKQYITSMSTTTHFLYLFTIQLTFPLYFPSLFTFQLTFLPCFPCCPIYSIYYTIYTDRDDIKFFKQGL